MKEPSDRRTPELKIRRRRLPHWTLGGSVYFVTFRLVANPLTPSERRLVLDQIKSFDKRFYNVVAAVVMPDHVHMLLRPWPGIELSRIMKGVKGVSARKLNQARGSRGSVWLGEWWDRIVRDQNELVDKLDYMRHNPLKQGLTDDPDQYEGWFWNGKLDVDDE